MKGFVYKWTNKINGNWYIGSHQGTLDDGYTGSGIVFINAIKKHGIENFYRQILYEGLEFRKEEERILKKLDAASDFNSYNLKNEAMGGSFPGEKNGMFGKKMSQESRDKISKTSKETYTEERRVSHSKKMTGSGNSMYGKNHSTFTKNKIRASKKAKKEEWGFLGTPSLHKNAFTRIYNSLAKHGTYSSPRGKLIIELENFNYTLPPYVRFVNFECRNLNVRYIKKEFLWYNEGNPYDLSIVEHAKMWKSLITEQAIINSNYGKYIFTDKQFDNVIEILLNDPESRRASIMILDRNHLLNETKDIPCTYSMNFRIRNNKLNMTVRMRSQDAIFGMCNDAPAFSFVHEMIFVLLKERYGDLELGEYYHSADSFHVYERHFDMLEKLTGYKLKDRKTKRERPHNNYSTVYCPRISSADEVRFIRRRDFKMIPEEFKFTKWINEDNDQE